MQDLLRFDLVGGPGPGLAVLEVMAAALRHGRSLRVEMRHDAREVVWTVFPNQSLLHCPLSAVHLSRLHLRRLHVERVELAALQQREQGATLAAAVARLRLDTTALSDIECWPGFDRERAQRLLNGLYLSAALMVSRAHPSALRDLTRHERAE